MESIQFVPSYQLLSPNFNRQCLLPSLSFPDSLFFLIHLSSFSSASSLLLYFIVMAPYLNLLYFAPLLNFEFALPHQWRKPISQALTSQSLNFGHHYMKSFPYFIRRKALPLLFYLLSNSHFESYEHQMAHPLMLWLLSFMGTLSLFQVDSKTLTIYQAI